MSRGVRRPQQVHAHTHHDVTPWRRLRRLVHALSVNYAYYKKVNTWASKISEVLIKPRAKSVTPEWYAITSGTLSEFYAALYVTFTLTFHTTSTLITPKFKGIRGYKIYFVNIDRKTAYFSGPLYWRSSSRYAKCRAWKLITFNRTEQTSTFHHLSQVTRKLRMRNSWEWAIKNMHCYEDQ